MDRRGFLKRCSILPFIGSLSVVAKAEKPESISRSRDEFEELRKRLQTHHERMFQVRLEFKNPKLEDIPENREWLDKVEEIVNAKFISPMAQIRMALKECNFPKEYISI